MQWNNRQLKQISREYVLDGYLQEHAAIFLPGWDDAEREAGQDIRTGLKLGVLDKDKPLYVVERNAEWAKLIADDLHDLGFTNLHVHCGELSTLVLRHRIDFAFIDLFGSLDVEICTWMRDVLAPMLAKDATVALTMAFARRNNQFMAECERIYIEEYRDFTSQVRYSLNLHGHQKLVPILLFKSIFENHEFAYRRLFKYRDTNTTMITFKFTNFVHKHTNNSAPTLDQIIASLKTRERKLNNMTNRSVGANKAWATRRANGWVHPARRELTPEEKRSQAAHKAWETRRANGWVHPSQRQLTLEEKRSQAAHKAWATRRANGWVHPKLAA